MSGAVTIEFRRRRKANLVNICGGQCCICGYHKSIAALEFHHIDPKLKKYGIAATGTCHNIEQDIEEVQKCILVCANCHREIHNNEYTIEQLKNYQQFDQQLAQKLIEETKNKYISQQIYCSSCGAPITKSSKTGKCNACANKSKIKPDREILKALVFENSFVAIGKQYGVSDNAVIKWCKSYNLPHLRSEIKKYTLTDWNEL